MKWLQPQKAVILSSILALAAGCTWGLGGEEDVPVMHRQFSRTVDIQTGVVQSDLERAKEAGAWLVAQNEGSPTSAGTAEYRETMLGHASAIAEAQDLMTVATRMGGLAASCGSCHIATGGGPLFVLGSEPPEGNSRGAQMTLHLWAADRMWEGLVGPSDEAWKAGTEALADLAPNLGWALEMSASPDRAGEILGELTRLATGAVETEGQGARGETYGRILETCRNCHSLAGG